MRLRLLFADWSETGRRSDVILFWLEHPSKRNIRRLHVKTPDDGQKNSSKHVEFHSENKFEKLVNPVGFIIRNVSQSTVTWRSNRCFLSMFIPKLPTRSSCCVMRGAKLWWALQYSGEVPSVERNHTEDPHSTSVQNLYPLCTRLAMGETNRWPSVTWCVAFTSLWRMLRTCRRLFNPITYFTFWFLPWHINLIFHVFISECIIFIWNRRYYIYHQFYLRITHTTGEWFYKLPWVINYTLRLLI
jgi:hypothetical protein